MSLLLTEEEMTAMELSPEKAMFMVLNKAVDAYYASQARVRELESDVKRLSDALAEAQERCHG